MSRAGKTDAALTLRIDAGVAAEAGNFVAQETHRQSILVSRRRSEREALEFITQTADVQGWK